MRLLALLLLVLSPTLAADDFNIEAQIGIGAAPMIPGIVAPPFTPLVVYVQRADTRPFSGRLVIRLENQHGRGPFGGDLRKIELVHDVNLEEGAGQAAFSFELPVFDSSVRGSATLERAAGGEFEPVASQDFTASSRQQEDRRLVGFVSQARLASMQPWLSQRLVELQLADLPDNWKILAGFDAIILNDDRLTRRQSEALVDYVVAGGNLILSPNSAAAYNPELPIFRLLGATAGAPIAVKLGDFEDLRKAPAPAEGGPERLQVSAPQPDAGAFLSLWPGAGRARASDKHRQLISHARCGAGSVVFIHADLSSYPLVTMDARDRTVPGICLLSAAIGQALPTLARPPLMRLASNDSRDVIDIAGKRIPNRDLQVLLIFLYVCAAGVGMFLLARRIKRPELYPAALLALAMLSVALVFSLGQVFKRAGDRARAVRMVVGDGSGGRNAVFTIGCAYVYEGNRIEFAQDRSSWLVPAQLRDGGWRGLPLDHLDFSAQVSPVEIATTVKDLTPWQNLFFASVSPAAPADLSAAVTGDGGTFTVENHSPHRLSGCIILVATATGTNEWHYIEKLEPAGSADARAPLSQATRAPASASELAALLRKAGNDDLAASAMIAFLGLPEGGPLALRPLSDVDKTLGNANLLPAEGEFLLLCMLPEDAVSKGSVGLRAVEPDRIGQAALWAARGFVEAR